MKNRPMSDYNNWDLIDEFAHLTQLANEATRYRMNSVDIEAFNHCELESEVDALRDNLSDVVQNFLDVILHKLMLVRNEMDKRGIFDE
jgi:hypothetical protein